MTQGLSALGDGRGTRLSELDPVVHTDLDLLMEARARALASLQTACAPNRRASLERTIADLDQRIADLSRSSASEAPT